MIKLNDFLNVLNVGQEIEIYETNIYRHLKFAGKKYGCNISKELMSRNVIQVCSYYDNLFNTIIYIVID